MAEAADSAGFPSGAGTTGAPGDLPKQYRPADHEGRIREAWERSGAFHPDPGRVLRGEAEPYCIIIPPPNVTDRLHLGHAFNNTLQDILTRAHRMMGYETLWMPGTDHAGIATQAVVERRLRKEGRLKGALKASMKREEFVAIVQSFKDEYEATITGQLKAMGCSCDWQRQRFTMDEQCARAVQEAFFRLFKDGLIYRGKRLVNWDPALQTAVADDECEDIEIDGEFYYLRYPLVHAKPNVDAVPVTWSELRARGWPAAEDAEHADEQQAWVTVATTRPETYLGDTAVAVNPRDPRAGALRGLSVELPLVGRLIPVIEDDYVVMPAREDDEAADPKAKFATGFLKVTPAHDQNDYEIGQRHKLPLVNIFAPDASVSDKHGWDDVGDAHLFVGLSREDARKKVIAEFKARTVGSESTAHLLAARRPYRHSVKHSDRSKAAIEPYLSDQWYVRVTDDRMAGAALRSMSQRSESCGAGVPPAAGVQRRLETRERRLPHWEHGGSTYSITFRTAGTTLSDSERQVVLDACAHWHGSRLILFAATVMPDHVHMLARPLEKSPGLWWSLSELLHSIKSFTAHAINKSRGMSGQVWQDESYDHLIRGAKDAEEQLWYIQNNPVRAGLAVKPGEYRFTVLKPEIESLRAALEAGRRDPCPTSLTFYPDRYAKTFDHWHTNIRDWCISRQLWWGHRIPVWSKKVTLTRDNWFRELDQNPWAGGPSLGDMVAGKVQGSFVRCVNLNTGQEESIDDLAPLKDLLTGDYLICICLVDHALAKKHSLESFGFVQDPDVLDTWFSSALWPMSTMGWPDDTDLLRAYDPSDVLCTSREIITLWVSRMTMFNRYLMPQDWNRGKPTGAVIDDMGRGHGPPPFRDVFIHAMIQDGEGRKMSKSLGNGVDPLDIIATHGADAMRFTLCQMTTHTQDVRMPVVKDPETGRNTSPKFDLGRNFANKLWNAARFALGILSSAKPTQSSALSPQSFSLVDRWMLSRLASGTQEIDAALKNYSFSVYAQSVYDLLWRDFCDWYLEAIKPTVAESPAQRAVLAHALETIVRLLHPIAPFITEALWESLREIETDPVPGIDLSPSRVDNLLATAGWPKLAPSLRDERAEREFERLRALITAVREVRAQHKVPPKRRVTLHLPAELASACAAAGPLVAALAGLEAITTQRPTAGVAFAFESSQCHLSNLADSVDTGAEHARLTKLAADLEKSERTLEGRLANPGYSEKAPPAMVQQTRDQLAKVKTDLSAARAALAALG